MSFSYGNGPGKCVYDEKSPESCYMIEGMIWPDLVEASTPISFKWDGVPVYYDLEKGRLERTGEIKITASRGEVTGEGRQARYDWSFKLEVPG